MVINHMVKMGCWADTRALTVEGTVLGNQMVLVVPGAVVVHVLFASRDADR